MFERFSESARQVVTKAQDEARALKHDYIGTEHLLLGLLVVPGIAQDVLGSVGVTADETRLQIRAMIGEGDETVGTGQIPFTPRTRKVLEASLRESLSVSSMLIEPEHLLLSLVNESEGVAARILGDIEGGAIRDFVVGRLASGRSPAADRAPAVDLTPRSTGARCKQALSIYGALFVCQSEDGDGHTEHVEHGDGWTMRWTA